MPFRLHGRAAVEPPQRQLFERRETVEILELRLATKIWRRLIAVEPNILKLVLRHFNPLRFVPGRAAHPRLRMTISGLSGQHFLCQAERATIPSPLGAFKSATPGFAYISVTQRFYLKHF